MKKLLMVFFVLSAFVVVNAASKSDMDVFPIDVDTCIIYDNTSNQRDTITAGTGQMVGPFELAPSNGSPMYKGFEFFALPISGTTKTIEAAYQILPFTSTTADTTRAAWTVIDTLTANGGTGYVDLTSRAGRSVAFRFFNYAGTNTGIIDDYVIAVFKKNEVFNIQK